MERPSLLLLDDHPTFSRAVACFLRAMGWSRLVSAASPDEGLTIVDNQHPQVVIVDLMERTVTLNTISEIRTMHPQAAIIALTDLDPTYYRHEAILAGADDFVSKWSLTSELVPTIMRILQARQAADAN